MTRAAVAARLAEIAGAPNVVLDPAQLAAYRIGSQTPSAAVRPASAQETAEIVKFAAAEKLAIVPSGARTKLGMGMPPRQYDLALDMTRLDRVVAYDPGDLTLGVEPGVTLRRLAGVLAEHRQFLPLAAPFMSQATIGGTIASGMETPLRQFYGTPRDYVLGIEFVTGEGLRAKGGGRVVKNVAGYDLHKLMIGALGTLGILTTINFRTFPLPAATRIFLAACGSAEAALELRRRVALSPLRPLTVEILSPQAAEMLTSNVAARIEPGALPPALASKAQWVFAASFAGSEAVISRCDRELRRMAEQAATESAALLSADETSCLLGRVREFVPIALESSAATTVVKLSVLPARMNTMLSAAAKAADASELRWAALARGVGVIYVALLPQARDDDARERVARATGHLLAECAAVGGNAVIPWCPGEWKGALPVWGLPRRDFAQMQKVKNAFDPPGILAPGRFAGGF